MKLAVEAIEQESRDKLLAGEQRASQPVDSICRTSYLAESQEHVRQMKNLPLMERKPFSKSARNRSEERTERHLAGTEMREAVGWD